MATIETKICPCRTTDSHPKTICKLGYDLVQVKDKKDKSVASEQAPFKCRLVQLGFCDRNCRRLPQDAPDDLGVNPIEGSFYHPYGYTEGLIRPKPTELLG